MQMTVTAGGKAPKTGAYTCVTCGTCEFIHKGDTVPECNRHGCSGTWRVS